MLGLVCSRAGWPSYTAWLHSCHLTSQEKQLLVLASRRLTVAVWNLASSLNCLFICLFSYEAYMIFPDLSGISEFSKLKIQALLSTVTMRTAQCALYIHWLLGFLLFDSFLTSEHCLPEPQKCLHASDTLYCAEDKSLAYFLPDTQSGLRHLSRNGGLISGKGWYSMVLCKYFLVNRYNAFMTLGIECLRTQLLQTFLDLFQAFFSWVECLEVNIIISCFSARLHIIITL